MKQREYMEDYTMGETMVSPRRTITEADIVLFAGVSGDNNAVHVNEEFAAATRVGGRIALYGVEETVALIERGLAGELAG